MIKNTIKTEGGYRRIRIHKNEVMISESQKVIDYNGNEVTQLKEKYQIVSVISVGEHQMAQCLKKGEITIFSISKCQILCANLPKTVEVKFIPVMGEMFVKVSDEEKQYIYDEVGNLVAADDKNDLSVEFAGCGVVLGRTDRKTGKKRLYNFEGCLVG